MYIVGKSSEFKIKEGIGQLLQEGDGRDKIRRVPLEGGKEIVG